ncbi:acetate kinase [Thermostichus vulcanus]|uniref:Acetate kinase n=1 Tax=Thermostichus vulcanus str. 'Rupite' TaxID=2813851 RepID=A0ABT0C8W0_THEVL|nr:acetate kinase [Thermostichus vulcanus str. 'Rupite']
MNILVINAGSSSLKSSLFQVVEGKVDATPLWQAQVDFTYRPEETLIQTRRRGGGWVSFPSIPPQAGINGLAPLFQSLWQGEEALLPGAKAIDAIGHRVVHGGSLYQRPTQISPIVEQTIEQLIPLAPAHNPAALEGIRLLGHLAPGIPQVAVFDTAFHQQMPAAAALYPLPYAWAEQGIRRYGFHGINHEYCARRAAELLNRPLSELRLITCHLGNGCSLAAIRGGKSVDTTMGYTPLEGLMMGSRSGSVDPGILIHQLRQGMSVEELDRILNRESGLKGVSGLSSDMRTVLEAMEAGHKRAELAFDLFIHRLRSQIGSMLMNLDRLDALVFSGGIGENSAPVRAATCADLGFLGIQIDPVLNAGSPRNCDISTFDAAVRVLVISAQEDWAIATACQAVLQGE